jgi:hypothetical protein
VELDQLVSQIQSDLKAMVKKKPSTDSTSNNNLASKSTIVLQILKN